MEKLKDISKTFAVLALSMVFTAALRAVQGDLGFVTLSLVVLACFFGSFSVACLMSFRD